jgi:hypothetical protein
MRNEESIRGFRVKKGEVVMSKSISLRESLAEGLQIVERCRTIQPREWGAEGSYIELVKQVGDLARHIMVHDGYYGPRDNQERYTGNKDLIADELVDIYTAVIRLADHYEIDLAEAIAKTRGLEDTWLKTKRA